jgi:hypothetical protein
MTLGQIAPTSQGPMTGGTELKIFGSGLNEVTVLIGERQADKQFEQDDGVTVFTPPADGPGPVDVRVRSRAGELVAPSAFTYLPAFSTSPVPPPTPPPTPSISDTPQPPSPEPS